MHERSKCVTRQQLIWATLVGYSFSVVVSVAIHMSTPPVVTHPTMVQQVNVGMEQNSLAKDIGLQYKKEKQNGL